MMKWSLKGVPEMRARVRSIAAAHPGRVGAALYQEAQPEMTESKKRCPVDVTPPTPHPGQLRNSGTVHPPEQHGNTISVTLSYGGGAIDYAIHVHENPDAFHPVGEWKYLESVINESRPFMLARLASRLQMKDANVS